MRKSSLDTNILLRLLLKDIPEQHVAARRLIELSDMTLIVSDTAIIELVFALERHYEFSRALIKEAVEALMGIACISLRSGVIRKALDTYVSCPKLSFEDCYLAEEAAVSNAVPLWTFDKKLASQSEHAQIPG